MAQWINRPTSSEGTQNIISRIHLFKEVLLVGPAGRGQLVLGLHGALDPVAFPPHLLLRSVGE